MTDKPTPEGHTPFDWKKVDACRHLLPPPGPEVVGECLGEIKRLKEEIAGIWGKVQDHIAHLCSTNTKFIKENDHQKREIQFFRDAYHTEQRVLCSQLDKLKEKDERIKRLEGLLNKTVIAIYGLTAQCNSFFEFYGLRKEIQEALQPQPAPKGEECPHFSDGSPIFPNRHCRHCDPAPQGKEGA